MSKKLTVKQNPESEVPMEVLAEAIVTISEGVKRLQATRIADRTLYMLIADAAPVFGGIPKQRVGIREVKAVLEGIASLEAQHLKKRKP